MANKLLLIILLLALVLRIVTIDFPIFSAEEARIAARANFLTTNGTDELGRRLPFIFNSSYDYQLPATSYLTALGVLIFGKTDLGVRIPFILIGVFTVGLIYLTTRILFNNNKLAILASVIAAFSPGLIFFSKIPNEYSILIGLITLLFFLFLQKRIQKLLILVVIILMLLTSKLAWFITLPLVLSMLVFRKDLNLKEKINIVILSIIPTIIIFLIFLNIPQGFRSIAENNFSVISDVSIKNGVDRLRGQINPEWPQIFDRVLINKSFLIIAGLFNWLSHFQLMHLFGQLDPYLRFGFLNMGGSPKIIIIPFLAGIYFSIRYKKVSELTRFLLPIIAISFMTLFIYPRYEPTFIILSLPLIILISILGFKNFNNKLILVIILLAIVEITINLLSIDINKRAMQKNRPLWVKDVAQISFSLSSNREIFILDDVINDFMPYLMWYTPVVFEENSNIDFPYRVIRTDTGNIKIINPNKLDFGCLSDNQKYIFIGPSKFPSFKNDIEKIFKDNFNRDIVYLVKSNICITK